MTYDSKQISSSYCVKFLDKKQFLANKSVERKGIAFA